MRSDWNGRTPTLTAMIIRFALTVLAMGAFMALVALRFGWV